MSLYRITGDWLDQNLVIDAVDYSDAEAYGFSLGWAGVAVLKLRFKVAPDAVTPAQREALG